jgi:hypothetical protein
MAFTDRCDIFGAVHEEGINRVVRHLMRQRPSLFNYATAVFRSRPELFCARIDAAQSVIDAGNPLFTEQKPLPVLGAPAPLGLNFCLQLTDAQIDFHPGNVITLPGELGALAAQRFALRMQACFGVDCPPKEVIDQYLPEMERLAIQKKLLVIGDIKEQKRVRRAERKLLARAVTLGPVAERGILPGGREGFAVAPRLPGLRPPIVGGGPVIGPIRPFPGDVRPPRGDWVLDPTPDRGLSDVLPTRTLTCFCLQVFAVGHFEWGTVVNSDQPWLKPRLDGIEIVDLQPTPMENAIECFISTTLRLGIFPRLIVPMEKLIFDITAMLREQGLELGDQISLQPSAVPTDVPNNPAIEQDQLKAFIKLVVIEGGA